MCESSGKGRTGSAMTRKRLAHHSAMLFILVLWHSFRSAMLCSSLLSDRDSSWDNLCYAYSMSLQ